MAQPADSALVYVVVTERPNRVWVGCEGVIHTAQWRTADNGDCLRKVVGNSSIINAALLAWTGEESFVLTFAELEERSQGYGAWSEGP